MPRNSVTEARTQLTMDTGMSLSLNLLKEMNKQLFGQSLMTSSFKSLTEQLKTYRPGALYSCHDKTGYQMDLNLNEAREQFLSSMMTSIKRDTTDDKEYVSATIKLILNLGIVRSNIEDFLSVLNLINTFSDKLSYVDITSEIQIISKFYGFQL